MLSVKHVDSSQKDTNFEYVMCWESKFYFFRNMEDVKSFERNNKIKEKDRALSTIGTVTYFLEGML